MNITVQVNSAELKAAFQKAPAKTARTIRDWVASTTLLVEREEKQEVPVRTGALQNSVHSVINGIKGEVKPVIYYAVFVNNGTRYQKANPFADRTYRIVKPQAERNAQNAVDQLVRSI